MNIGEKAVECHGSGLNCAQSVLAACCGLSGLDETEAKGIGSGLGGGVNCGEICGALNGAVISLSAAMPYTSGEEAEKRDKIRQLSKELCAAFEEKFGSVRCEDLLAGTYPDKLCDEYIRYGAEKAEELINKNK